MATVEELERRVQELESGNSESVEMVAQVTPHQTVGRQVVTGSQKVADATITDGTITDGTITTLDSTTATISDLTATAADITTLTVGSGVIDGIPSCHVYHNADQSIPNETLTLLSFNSERWDTDAMHDTSTNNSRITCKVAGKYSILGTIAWEQNNSGVRLVYMRLNGSTYICVSSQEATSGFVSGQIVQQTLSMSVSDYVQLLAYQDCGDALNVERTASYTPEFSMVWIG